MKSITQDWVNELGLRHQGVLMTAIRGCDSVPKIDASKSIVRAFRADVLNAHVSDPRKAKSFIQFFDHGEFIDLMNVFTSSLDHYPLHYVMHLAHAAEVVGYKHPDQNTSDRWRILYFVVCKRLHVNPETEAQLDARLNKTEEEFAEDGNGFPEPISPGQRVRAALDDLGLNEFTVIEGDKVIERPAVDDAIAFAWSAANQIRGAQAGERNSMFFKLSGSRLIKLMSAPAARSDALRILAGAARNAGVTENEITSVLGKI